MQPTKEIKFWEEKGVTDSEQNQNKSHSHQRSQLTGDPPDTSKERTKFKSVLLITFILLYVIILKLLFNRLQRVLFLIIHLLSYKLERTLLLKISNSSPSVSCQRDI